MTQVENHELSSDTMALHRRESASLWEGNAADMKKFQKMMRKYLEQYEAESVAL